MTATISTVVDLHPVLQRADRRYAAEHCAEAAESGYLSALAQAVQAQLPTPPGQPGVPAQRGGEDEQRRAEMAGHLAERIEDLERDAAELADQLQQARGELEAERRRAAGLGERHADMLAENVELVDRLDSVCGEREQLVVALDELRDEVTRLRKDRRQPRPKPVPHRHFYPWLGIDAASGPCECGKPYPRAIDEGEDVEPDLEPLDAMFARIRAGADARR